MNTGTFFYGSRVFQSEGEHNYGCFCEDNTQLGMVWEVLTNMYENFPRERRLWGCHSLTVHSIKPPVCSVNLWTQCENEAADIEMCYHLRYNPAVRLHVHWLLTLDQSLKFKREAKNECGKFSVILYAHEMG